MIAITGVGCVGYMFLEGWGFVDALYMTVITFSTVGFGEVHPVSGAGRVFTIFLILSGGGFAVYVGGVVIQFVVEGKLRDLVGRRRLDNKIKQVNDHYIVCGYGRIGRVLCNQLRAKPIDLVVIEKDPALVPVMEEDQVLYLNGDASDENLLRQAGIDRSKTLVAALATDTDNVFLVLTARQLNPSLFILARCGHKESYKKLLAAGANMVESPYDMGARTMALRLLRPTVTDFLDSALARKNKDIQLEEIPVAAASPLCGVSLMDSGIRQQYNLIIIAISREQGGMEFNPPPHATIECGDTVIAIGEEQNLRKLEQLLVPAG